MIERATGRLRSMTITGNPGRVAPPSVVTELAKQMAQYERVRAEINAADERLLQLEHKLREAREQDRATYARALLKDPAGAADPGERQTAKVEAMIAKEMRRFEALDAALAGAEDAILTAIETNREKMIARLTNDAKAAEVEADEAERRAREARRKASEIANAIGYIDSFPSKNLDFSVRELAERRREEARQREQAAAA